MPVPAAILLLFAAFFAGRLSVRYFPTLTGRRKAHDHKANHEYKVLTHYYPLYNMQYDIVMLGDSLVQYVNWNELLQRHDIANRGVGGDVTAGILSRLPEVLTCKPKICFVEGGINDVWNDIPVQTTANNLKAIVQTLQTQGIQVILHKLIYVSKDFPNAATINAKADEVNTMLDGIQDISFIDLNPQLAKDGYLLAQYALPDGIHLSAAAYSIWADEVKKWL